MVTGMARPLLIIYICCALGTSSALCGQTEDCGPLDSVALVQSRMLSGSRQSEAVSSASHDRCAAPRGQCSRRTIQSHASAPSSRIVITRSRGEDLRWLDALPDMDTLVFNRYGLDELLPTPRPNLNLVRQEEDPLYNNLGPEDGMLRFITENYDSLPDVTVFLQGWPFQHCADARDLITRAVLTAHRPSDLDFVSNGAQAGLVPMASTFLQYDIELGHVGYTQEVVRNDPKIYDPKIGVEVIAALAFNKTCRKALQRRCNNTMWVAQGSQWAVTRERILKTPKEDYEHALQVPPGSGGRLRELVLEALWPSLWGAPAWTPGLVPQRAAPVLNLQVKSMHEALNNLCVFSTDGGLEKQCEEDAGFCHYSQSRGDASDSQAMVELRPLLQRSEAHGVCPRDYTFDDGNVPGPDQFGLFLIKESITQCGEYCDNTEKCQSFEWSATTKICKLNKDANPKAARIADFLFCRSNSVPASEAAESKPEKKVPLYLQGRISAPRAREIRAKEAEQDLFLRVDKAFNSETTKQLERRMHCSHTSLSTPALAVVGKKWRLVAVGYPFFHIQVADFVSCLIEPVGRAKRQLLPCTSSKPTIKWELRKVPAGFQLVSNSGKCLVRLDEGVSAEACEPDNVRQIFQLDMERTGKYYEKLALDMTVTEHGKLHVSCVTQLNSQAELVKPVGVQQSQIVRWRMTNASATHGEGAYFLSRKDADERESYLSCRDERKKPEVVLQPNEFAWFVHEGKDGGVSIESKDGSLLRYDPKQGSLFCFANKDGTDITSHLTFTLGIPQTPSQPTQQLF